MLRDSDHGQVGEPGGEACPEHGDEIRVHGDIFKEAQKYCESADDDEKWCARRMRNSQGVGTGDEFAAVPEGKSRRHGFEENEKRN